MVRMWVGLPTNVPGLRGFPQSLQVNAGIYLEESLEFSYQLNVYDSLLIKFDGM